MNQPETIALIKKLYEKENSKKFIIHLIRAFLPLGKAKILEKWHTDKKPKCCLCASKIIPVDELMKAMLDKELLDADLQYIIAKHKGGSKEKKDIAYEIIKDERPMNKFISDRKRGYIGDKSDKLLCTDCQLSLYSFTSSQILSGDGTLNWVFQNKIINKNE
ncbi:MAG: hypothetical protein WCT85_01455 [Parachlamydiales bacterium]